MKKIVYLLFCSLLIVEAFFNIAPEAVAQVTKVDATKTPSKITVWFQTQKAKCEKIMESVQTSQFGQFVGDGIKYTKEGIKFAKDVYDNSIELYGELKDKVLNSAEYKMAMISKEIAEESQKLKDLQEEKLKKQEAVQAEIDLLKEQTSAKISSIQQNAAILAQAQNEQTTEAEALTTRSAAELEAEQEEEALEKSSEMEGIEVEIEQIQSEMEMQLDDYESEIENIEDEYEEKILEQGEKIAKLTQELAEVSSSSSLIKKQPRDSSEALQETQDKFLLPRAPSIKEEKKIKKQRKQALSDVIVETSTTKADKQLSRASTKEKTDSKEELGDTMTGESEGSGVSAEVLTEQLHVLRSYIDVVLADLKLQASIEVNNLRKVSSEPLEEKFNLCDYTDQSNVGLEGIKKKASGAMSKVNELQEKVADVQGKISEAKEKVDQAKETVSNVQDQYQQVKDMAKEAEGIAKNYNIDIATDPSTIGVF